ncbi:MAG TPA: protein kinase [Haliangium sp.]|nr:protein kinase [Haliangium sp.]
MSRTMLPMPSAGQAPQYKLLGRIASGGMGSVYLAVDHRDASAPRLVAIKIIHSHLAENRVFVDMLLDEAQVASNIHHPNVVGITDVGAFRGRHFVVMPYVEGGTLSELVRRQQRHLPMALVAHVLTEALHGLQAAHSLVDAQGQSVGLVHRDVSPGNILLGTDGITRVIDFGVAKAASRITHTAPGTVKGKFAYMAPEQAMGDQVDCRADVFSVGVVLWTVLTGKRLFNGKNSAHTIRNLMSAEIIPPSHIRPKIPHVLEQVCMHALQRDRERRYQSAADMAADLRRAAMAAGLETSQAEVGSMVSAAFAERIARRRSIFEESMRAPQAVTVDQPGFELEVVDLDERAAVDSLTPPTPSVRGPRRAVGFEQGSTPTGSGASSLPVKQSETFSAMSEVSAGMRDMHSGLTPAEAHSVAGLVSGSLVPLDREAVVARKPRPRGHGKYFVIAVLLMIAGAAFAMRDRVLALYTQITGAPVFSAPDAPQPAITDPVRIPLGDDTAPDTPEQPVTPGETAVADPASGPAAAPGTEPPAEGAGTPAEATDPAAAGAAAAQPGTGSGTEGSAAGAAPDTAAGTASDTPSDTASDTPSGTASGTASGSSGQARRKQRRESRPRNDRKKPPLDIEKNPYLD